MKKRKSENSGEKIKKRVAAIARERPSHKKILEFFRDIVTEQHMMRPKVKTAPVEIDKENIQVKIKEGFPLVEKSDLTLDVASAKKLFRRLCKILGRNKKTLRDTERINKALRDKDIDLAELFKQASAENEEYINELSKRLKLKDGLLSFLARNSIKPVFEAYASELKNFVDQEMWWRGYCPICGSEPSIAELKKEGTRFLVCSSCSYEWRFTRLRCPFCENEQHKGHRYFYTEKEGTAYRVEVCEKCKRYIKTIDTKKLGEEEVIPLIEDIGTLYLDILAQKEGYTREKTAYAGSIDA